jgi:spermidine synthase
VFLVGVALGSALMTPFSDRSKAPYRLFSILQVFIGITSIASFFVLYYVCYTLGDKWFHEYDVRAANIRWNAALAIVFLRTAATMFVPTFCMGLAFPVAVRTVTLSSATVGRDVGRLYAVNTIGAILGAALTGFLILPVLGIARTIFLMGALQLCMGTYLLLVAPETTPVRRAIWAVVSVAALILSFPYHGAFFHPLDEFEKLVFYKEGPLATVSVVENSLDYRTIYVDNVGVAGTDPMLLTDQKSLAHVPMLLLKNPKSALTVGFGSGGASYSYTLHPGLEKINCVEITKTVVEAAPTLTASNHQVVINADLYSKNTGQPAPGYPLWPGNSTWKKSDPRYSVILDDARSYLRFNPQKYDIIATDCTDLRYKSNANLYDLEYFQLTRERLTDDGMVVVWMPLAGLSEDAFKVALRTFYRVFPEMEVFYMNNEPTHYILLIGTKHPLSIDPELIRKRLENRNVAADLHELFLDSPEKIVSCFICGRRKLDQMLKGQTLNTEDFPYLEFESPRYGYGDEALLDNLDLLMKYRESPARLLSGNSDTSFSLNLERYYKAIPEIIAGHREYRLLHVQNACKHYMKALAINPGDESVGNLLNFVELRRKVRGQPDNIWARLQLGMVLAMQNQDGEAASELNILVAQTDTLPPGDIKKLGLRLAALDQLATIYERANKHRQSAEYQELASKLRGRGIKPLAQ